MVSVIILTYNRYPLLSKTILSILGQTYKDIEVLIINDGSTDETFQLSKVFNDERIRLFNLEKQNNLAKLRNTGVKNSTGEYIAFCDDDDLWEPDKLEIQFKYLNKYDFICSNAKLIDINGDIVDNKYIKIHESTVLKTEMLIQDNVIMPSSVIFKKNILKTDSPFDEENFINLCEDYNLWIKLSLENELFFLNQELISHRTHNSWARSYEHFRQILNNHLLLIKPFTKSKSKSLREAAYMGLFNTRLYGLKYFLSKKKFITFGKEFFKFILQFKNPLFFRTFYYKCKIYFLKRLKTYSVKEKIITELF